MAKLFSSILSLLLSIWISLTGCDPFLSNTPAISLDQIPEYSGAAYVEVEGNVPDFSADMETADAAEQYSPLDLLGRCGEAFAKVGPETMPTEERGAIGQVKPSGWHLVKYDCVDGKYLYNRCHLIGYQLTGENANECNLITGTRYLNVTGMLPFENQVADYVEETGNHVLYRVTPVFRDTELVARGVQMEAWSVEDEGAGVCFNVYVYNVQPGVEIDYATGESWLAGTKEEEPSLNLPEISLPIPELPSLLEPSGETTEQGRGQVQETDGEYVLNLNSRRIHRPDCSGVATMSPKNKQVTTERMSSLLERGYTPCGQCKPDEQNTE